eukprot:g4166.t1
MKLISKINSMISNSKVFYTFEFFPPKTSEGRENLLHRIDRMANFSPLFINVTWTPGSTSLDLAIVIQKCLGLEVLLHLTCTGLSRDELRDILQRAKDGGIQNILALRGDAAGGTAEWKPVENGFTYAIDLVKFIKTEFDDYFGIAVAGFPEGHIESSSAETDIQHLKEKIDAGADFVITQLFYDVDLCINFIKKCRSAGITCPIIPGIMPIQTYSSLRRTAKYCKVSVPDSITKALEPFQANDADVKKFGIELGVKMIKALMKESILVPGFHFYTLNLEKSVIQILNDSGLTTKAQRLLPWRTCSRRATEDVRPIFWANRPRSYLSRTDAWDEFPNGRWGDSRSPAFGRLSEIFGRGPENSRWTVDERRTMWGEAPQTMEDIHNVFVSYVSGETKFLPWCENELALETGTIKNQLIAANKLGCMTINSQPKVNAVDSEDKTFGWGGPKGLVYQKAYVEFLCSAKSLALLMNEIEVNRPSLTYHAVDRAGNSYANHSETATAVTWGVWPKSEVKQPTVVDPVSFLSWKDECFALLLTWAQIYPEESTSSDLIYNIYDNYFLVNIVDNDFVQGDLFSVFDCLKEEDTGR